MVRTQDDRSTTNTSRNSYLDNAFLDIPNNLNNCLTKTLLSSVSREGGGGLNLSRIARTVVVSGSEPGIVRSDSEQTKIT